MSTFRIIDLIELQDRTIDLAAREVRQPSGTQSLTPNEVELLRYLSQRRFTEVSNEDILRDVWEYHPSATTRAANHAIQRLRRKLERDPAKPQHLITVRGVGYRFEPLTKDETIPALPADRDVFIGREEGLNSLRTRFDNARLVTILGIGGMGKTRLAKAFARSLDHPVLFVDLVDATSANDIVVEALSAANVEPSADPQGQWLRLLERLGPVTVIADNFEHLMGFANETLGQWLDSVAELRVLATSRERLGLTGEAVLDLGPLTLDDGIALLEERVSLVGTLEPLASEDAKRIVKRVDCIPLAIQLAAAQLRVQSVSELLKRLESGQHRLKQTTRDGPPRHATLSGALTDSWEALSPALRAVLSQCAVFHGGFTTQAAVQVIQCDGDVLMALQELRDSALVTCRTPGRLDMLEPVRQFVRAQSSKNPAAARRHAQWVHDWVHIHYTSGHTALWTERKNIRAALEQAAATTPTIAARMILVAEDLFIWSGGGANWIFKPLEQVCQSLECIETKLKLELFAAKLATVHNDRSKAATLSALIYQQAEAHGLKDIACQAACRVYLCLNFISEDGETETWMERIRAFDGHVGANAQSWIWRALAEHATRRDDFATTMNYCQRVTQQVRSEGDTAALVQVLVIESRLTNEYGRPVDARELLREASDIARSLDLQFSQEGLIATQLALTITDLGHPIKAASVWQSAVDTLLSLGQTVPHRTWFIGAVIYAVLGKADDALAFAQKIRATGLPIFTGLGARLEGCMHQSRGELDLAIGYFQESLRIFRRINEARNAALTEWMLATALAESARATSNPALAHKADAILAQPLPPKASDERARLLHGLCLDHVQFIKTGVQTRLQNFAELQDLYAVEQSLGHLPAHWRWTQLRHRMLERAIGADIPPDKKGQ